MTKTRIIPVLLRRGLQLVKGKQYDSWRSVGVARQAALIHEMRGVDEMFVLDIEATPQGRGPDVMTNKDLTTDCFMPIAVGGGMRTEHDIMTALANGADKIVIGTAAYENSILVYQAARRFGSQAIVVSIDVKDGRVYTRCGSRLIEGLTPEFAARAFQDTGAGEILLNSIERDGMMDGYDLEMICKVSGAVSIPVVACGGCGCVEHMAEALDAGASAVAAGSLFLFTDVTPRSAAKELARLGYNMRLAA